MWTAPKNWAQFSNYWRMTNPMADQLPLKPFGKTGLQVTTLCVGCSGMSSWPDKMGNTVSVEQSVATLRNVFASPINYLDTAAGYGDGTSEERIGMVLREMGGLPKGYVISTKVDPDAKTGDFSGEQTKKSIERSMKLLGLDRLQILFLHDPEVTTFENLTQPGGAVDVMLDYKRQGIVDQIGVAGGPIDLMIRFCETGNFDAVLTHNRYTLLNRSAEPLLQMAEARGMTMLNAAPYGGGMLAKGTAVLPKYRYRPADRITLERAKQMEAICNEYGVPISAAALQFSLRDPRLTSTVVGISQPQRVAETLQDAQTPISDEMWERLDAVGYETQDV